MGKINRKIFIFLIATIFVVLILCWGVVFLLGGKVKESFENYQKEKLNSFVLEEKRNKISKLKRDLPDLEREKTDLEKMLIKKDEALPLLRMLEKIAADTSCVLKIETADVSKIKFTNTKKQPSKSEENVDSEKTESKDEEATAKPKKKEPDELADLKNFPAFSIEATGHFSSLVDFLGKFENVPYFLRPLIVDFSPAGKSGSGANRGGNSSGAFGSTGSESASPEEKNVTMRITFVVYAQ